MTRCTYSPEDDKLRIYPDGERLDSDKDWYTNTFKAKGKYKWAAKQECFVAYWSPFAEDIAIELSDSGEIDDEDYSMLERSADRAERFGGYRDKRRAEAGEHADDFESGPQVFGNQNAKRAERQAVRHDKLRGKATTQWSKAEYWERRTEGVISHALHKSKPEVRRGRILEIEKQIRKRKRAVESSRSFYDGWSRVLELPGNDVIAGDDSPTGGRYSLVKSVGSGSDPVINYKEATDAMVLAFTLANYGFGGYDFQHPRTGKTDSLYGLMRPGEDSITPKEAAELYLSKRCNPHDGGSHSERVLAHLELRLTYENAMLENEGGKASELNIEPGGWFGNNQVQAVNRSPQTGLVTSVKLWTTKEPWGRTRTDDDGKPVKFLRSFNIQRLGTDSYRSPTPEEKEQFEKDQKEAKSKAKASRPKQPSLINPTKEDAERLQALWRQYANEKIDDYNKSNYGTVEHSTVQVRYMTQKQYSENSRGSHSHLSTVGITADGKIARRGDTVVFKIRKSYGGGCFTADAERVICLTDKPQKPLPLEWESLEKDNEPQSQQTLF